MPASDVVDGNTPVPARPKVISSALSSNSPTISGRMLWASKPLFQSAAQRVVAGRQQHRRTIQTVRKSCPVAFGQCPAGIQRDAVVPRA